MYSLVYTSRMKKDLKTMVKRGKDVNKLKEILKILVKGGKLAQKHNDHRLQGGWNGFRECHIEPDWLLIYKIEETELILFATATGTHADLFW